MKYHVMVYIKYIGTHTGDVRAYQFSFNTVTAARNCVQFFAQRRDCEAVLLND